jgi:mercuric reductase
MKTLNITGMTCEHCAISIEKALNKIDGIQKATVSFENSRATVNTNKNIADKDIIDVVKKVGYGASVIESKDSKEEVHIAIIGSGAAAFAAAIKASEGGAKVTMIESGVTGGTCVNIGCVPSKIMIRSAHIAHLRQNSPFDDGIEPCKTEVNREVLLEQQQKRVDELRHAKYENILEINPSINLVHGFATFKDIHTLQVELSQGGTQEIKFDKALIATGASPFVPDVKGLRETPFWTSTEALVAQKIPQRLAIYGSSSVALELAQAYQRLGSSVTLIARSTLLSREDDLIGEELEKILKEEGMQIIKNANFQSASYENHNFKLTVNDKKIESDELLIATGQKANTLKLGLENIGVEINSNGAVVVDVHLQTSVKHIYAGGDCTSNPAFVYVAAAAGTRAAANMLDGDEILDISIVPAVVFTEPQIAIVGLDEKQAKQKGYEVDTRVLGLENVPRALANFDTNGFIKMVAQKDTGLLLGVQALCDNASDIIQTATLALRAKMSVQELASELFPYLSMVEGLKLCAQTFNKDVKQLSCCAG